MTDLTDQDRRAARAWAKNWQGDLDADTSAAARVILATVDAPEPTLTERLREQFYDPEPTDEQHGIILDAEQLEHDLAEARAEGERLSAVQKGSQKGAESNAESLDPADVKPGEAWVVDVDGERRTAVKDRAGDVPWSTIDANGRLVYKRNGNVTLVSRLVPAPRVITDPVELDAMPERSIVRDHADGEAMQKFGTKWVPARMEHHEGFYSFAILPATVLWEPEA